MYIAGCSNRATTKMIEAMADWPASAPARWAMITAVPKIASASQAFCCDA